MSLQIPEPSSSAAREFYHPRQTLGKGLARAGPVGATETASCHSDHHGSPLPGKIIEHAPIDAVNTPGCHAAGRTFGGGLAGHCLDGDLVRSRQHPGHLERARDEGQQV
jgi:hypothetical protein